MSAGRDIEVHKPGFTVDRSVPNGIMAVRASTEKFFTDTASILGRQLQMVSPQAQAAFITAARNEFRATARRAPRPVPPVVEDAEPTSTMKPDPAGAATMGELLGLLREFWEWCGRPSSRRIAVGSENSFSHTTVAKLLNGTGKVPQLTLEYVRGLVLGCGGGPDEVARWVTAWRRVALNRSAERPLRVVNQ